ncbi:c-type cytochrome biogenesis protein CcmI [Ignatzschineria sp. LJL83]
MMGLIYTILFIVATMLILVIAFWGKGSEKFSRLQTVYRDKYIDEAETLDDDLKRGKITEEEYEETKVELVQDLLAVAHPDRQLNDVTKFILVLFAGALITLSGVYFWDTGYKEEAKELDTQRTAAMPYVQKWLASLTVEDLQRSSNMMDLNPPVELQENLLGTLTALNVLSSADHHTDAKELHLLGKMYLNMNQLPLAEKVYLDLYRINPEDNNVYYSLLNIQLAMNDYKLNPRLEGLFDQFVMGNRDNEELAFYYATVLFENQKMEKAIAFFSQAASNYAGNSADERLKSLFEDYIRNNPSNDSLLLYYATILLQKGELDQALYYFSQLAEIYPEGSENRRLILNMIAGLLGQETEDMKNEAALANTAINVEIQLPNASLNNMPQNAILFLFVRNMEMGPPLAAKRIPLGSISEFPLGLNITEQDVLMPGMTLSGHEKLTIAAKISMNGDPITKAGDIEAETIVVEDLSAPITIILDRVVE